MNKRLFLTIFLIFCLGGIALKSQQWQWLNPANDRLSVQIPVPVSKGTLCVTDVAGKPQLQREITGSPVTLDTRDLCPGVYFLRLTSDPLTETVKFVKR